MSLSENIKNLRKEKGLSQQGLADAIYVSRSTVAKWENGLGIPSDANLASMAAYFKVMEYEITGEPSEWEKEMEKIKKADKIYKMRFFVFAAAALIVLSLSFYMLLCIPKIKKSKHYMVLTEVTTTSKEKMEVEIVKQAGPFSKGEVCVSSYSSDYLPDEITFKNGALNHTYKITYVYSNYKIKSDVLYVPSYATVLDEYYFSAKDSNQLNPSCLSSWHDFNGIKVSPKNSHYDSREDCNCLIETETNRLLMGSYTSTIPSTVTEIADYAFWFNDNVLPETFVIPGSVKRVGSQIFNFRYTDNLTAVKIEEGVEVLESGCFSSVVLKNIVLPSSIKELGMLSQFADAIYYTGSKENFMNLTFIDYDNQKESEEFYASVEETDTFHDVKVYYYSYYEPADKTNLWHYDAEGNPVLWSEEN